MGAKSVKMVAPFFVPKLIGEPHGAFLTPQTITANLWGEMRSESLISSPLLESRHDLHRRQRQNPS